MGIVWARDRLDSLMPGCARLGLRSCPNALPACFCLVFARQFAAFPRLAGYPHPFTDRPSKLGGTGRHLGVGPGPRLLVIRLAWRLLSRPVFRWALALQGRCLAGGHHIFLSRPERG